MFLNMNKKRLYLSNKRKISTEYFFNYFLELFEVKRSNFLKKIAKIVVVVLSKSAGIMTCHYIPIITLIGIIY